MFISCLSFLLKILLHCGLKKYFYPTTFPNFVTSQQQLLMYHLKLYVIDQCKVVHKCKALHTKVLYVNLKILRNIYLKKSYKK